MNNNYDITYENLYHSANKCSLNVKWKKTVAHYLLNQLEETYKLKKSLDNGTYKERRHKVFKIYEPKEREVLSIAFRDRVYQRLICDEVIYPIMTKSFIYDNCACQKGKGTDFARNRVKTHLRRFYQHYGDNKGYIIHIDIKKYYPSMSHEKAISLFRSKLPTDIFKQVETILNKYKGNNSKSRIFRCK